MQSPPANLLLTSNWTRTVADDSTRNTGTEIAALSARLRAGDEEAFREFHQLYFDRLYRFLLVVARGREDEARDALQETLLRVIRYARRFDTEEAFWSWLKSVARNAARDGGRKQSRYLCLLQRFATFQGHSNTTPESTHHLGAVLEESLEEIDAADRRMIEAKYLQGSSVRELAAGSGLTEKAVESRLLRLRRQIREGILRKLRTP